MVVGPDATPRAPSLVAKIPRQIHLDESFIAIISRLQCVIGQVSIVARPMRSVIQGAALPSPSRT
eukprot:9471108-Pyramimonas_sp.AAC.1